MAVITVPAAGVLVSNATFNDLLEPGSDVASNGVAYYEVDGTSTLQSLFIGYEIELIIGFLNTGTLTGTGNITGAADSSVGTLPSIANYGTLDVNGAIDVALTNYSRIVVAAGERLDVEGDLFAFGASTISVSPGGELDIGSLNVAVVGTLDMQGTLKVTAPLTTLGASTALAGAVIVQGDAPTGFGSGALVARSTGNAGGTYVATLDVTQAALAAPINSLTLGSDAEIQFGTGAYTVKRLSVAGSPAGVMPVDVVQIGGTLTVTGDGSGAPNQVTVRQAKFSGAGTIDFAVAAADGSAILQQQLTVDANTTLRNDGSMILGGQASGTSTLGDPAAAAGSVFVNGAGGQLTISAGATLSVAAIQNAGTIDITSGTLTLDAAVTGSGTFAVESGATLKLSDPSTFAGVVQPKAVGAVIDLAGVSATSATVVNGAITLATGAGTITLAETGLINGATLGLASDGAGGSLVSAPLSAIPHPAVYRFFDTVHGTHFFTASSTEATSLEATRTDLTYEGVGLDATDPSIDPAAAPVYRFFDTNFGTHFYTSSATEKDTVIATRSDLTFEGIGFYEHTTAQAGDVPVYRFFDQNFGTHFYTASTSEQATIVATRPDLVSEGIGFYAPST